MQALQLEVRAEQASTLRAAYGPQLDELCRPHGRYHGKTWLALIFTKPQSFRIAQHMCWPAVQNSYVCS
jgi:hypothetical protein